MAYNPVSVGSINGEKRYLFRVEKLSGGCTSNEENASDTCVASMTDMYSDGSKLITRGGMRERAGGIKGKYNCKFSEEYYGNIIFHAGTSLYRFDGEAVHLLLENTGEGGFFLRMNAKVYFYSRNERVYEIDAQLNCTEVLPHAPVVIKNANINLSSFDAGEPFNMLTRRIRCSYPTQSAVNSLRIRVKLPYALDESAEYSVYSGTSKLRTVEKNYDPTTKTVDFHILNTQFLKETVEVEYAVLDEAMPLEKYTDMIYGSKLAFCYGGTTKDGTRAFVTGNPNYPSAYFRSELKDPLFFPDTCKETLGDGSENVFGVEKRYEKMYFFTSRHIYSMSYSFTEEGGAVFTINSVNTGVGCDMEGTVTALDNTIVFAEKSRGVHILQSTDIFDELNILPISENLRGDTGTTFGKDGKYFSCDHDRKYFISNGSAVYMWDYGRVPFYSGAEYRTKEEKLPWFRVASCGDKCDMFSLSGRLYFIVGTEEISVFEYAEDFCEDTFLSEETQTRDESVLSSFTTKKYDFGTSHIRKRLLEFSFDYANASGTDRKVFLTVFGDGKMFCTAKARLTEKQGRITVRIPAYSAYGYSVRAAFDGGGIGVSKLSFLWRRSERVKHCNK